MRLIAAILVILGLLVPAAHAAAAAKRVALVMGNGAYAQVPALANPRADAEAMAAALRRLGFDVELGIDLDLAGMRRAVQGFARKLQGADMALFFYAGHGMQVHGQNYLLPVDAALESEADLDFAAVPARLVLSQMERWPAVKIVLLDACRDNPFADTLRRSLGASRASAVSRGLAPIETAGGTLVAYATDPGDVAADGEGAHSPFTEALLEHVETPGVEINTMLARVRAEVYESTGRRQRPWTETSLIGEVYLAPEAPEPPPVEQAMMAPQAPAVPVPPQSGLDPRAIELALWEAAQAGGTAADYEEYLRQYPDGIFARLAANRVAALRAAEGSAQGGPGPAEAGEADKRPGDRTQNAPAGAEQADGSGAPEVPGQDGAAAEEPGAGPEAGIAALPEPAPGSDEATAGLPEPSPDSDDEIAAVPGPAPEPSDADAALPAPDAVEAALGLDAGQRREVQARLMVAGHDPRGIDGIFGPGTRTALSAWQAAEGLAATGYLDAAALDRLERSTEADYVAWVARQRQAEAERRAAAEARRRTSDGAAPRQRALDAEAAAALQRAPVAPAPAVPTPTPQPETPTVQATEKTDDGRSVRERYEQECYFVFSGKPQLERRCKP